MFQVPLLRRRRRETLTFLSEGNSQLISDLGGTNAVLGFWDRRDGVLVKGSGIDTHYDTRGTSVGKPLLQTSDVLRPAYNPNTKVITYGAVSSMRTAIGSLYSLAPAYGIALIANVADIDSALIAGLTDNGSSELNFFTTTAAPSLIQGRFGATFVPVAGASVSATVRLHLITKDTGTNGWIETPTLTRATTAAGTSTGSSWFEINSTVDRFDAAIIVDHQFSAGEITALQNYATTRHSAVLY